MAGYNDFGKPRQIDKMSASDPIAGPLGDLLTHLMNVRELWDIIKTQLDAGIRPFGMDTSHDNVFLAEFAKIRTITPADPDERKAIEYAIIHCQAAMREIITPTAD